MTLSRRRRHGRRRRGWAEALWETFGHGLDKLMGRGRQWL